MSTNGSINIRMKDNTMITHYDISKWVNDILNNYELDNVHLSYATDYNLFQIEIRKLTKELMIRIKINNTITVEIDCPIEEKVISDKENQ